MSKFSLWRTIVLLCVFSAMAAIGLPAQTLTTLHSFNGTDGNVNDTDMVLVQGTDGNFYGTTAAGGAYSGGTVFKMTPGGTLNTLYSFCAQMNCTDGAYPNQGTGGGALVQASDGNFYGTTSFGGANDGCGYTGCGTVFKMTPTGALTPLYSFCAKAGCADGFYPAGLVQATDGNFYGTTQSGGASAACGSYGCGTVFKWNPTTGVLTTLYNFCSQLNCTDGDAPMDPLIQATDGNLYGTTWSGGNGSGGGTVFKISLSGKLTTLATVGGDPSGALVQATDGNFYGTTARGGTIFKMTPGGVLTTLNSDCCYLYAGLVQATDGNLYGTTFQGGNSNNTGTVFEVIPQTGALSTLYSFCPDTLCTDGAAPLAALLQATNGTLYGTTTGGGAYGDGTIFSLSVGLGPFVEAVTYSGKVGNTIEFLGQNFTPSSTVSFNGTTSALVAVKSPTFLTATVPSGATTGSVTVTTSRGTLTSNKAFRVIPQITTFSPTSGPVGTSVTISGISLTQTTKVTFGGVAASSVIVNSDTQLTATVPSGAKSGKITVTTRGGTATSSGTFTVT